MSAGFLACLALVSGLACAAANELTSQQGAAAVDGAQLSGMQVDASSGAITLQNIRLPGVSVKGVLFLPQQPQQAPAHSAPANNTGEPLDWEQRWHRDGTGASFSVSAALPAALTGPASPALHLTVEVHCQGCGGSLGSTAVHLAAADGTLGAGGEGAAGSSSGIIIFILQGASSPADGARSAHLREGVPRHVSRTLHQLSSTAEPTPLLHCSLSVDPGQPPVSFQGCQAVPLQPSALYHVYYSLEPGPAGGTLWRGGLKINASAVGGQWAG